MKGKVRGERRGTIFVPDLAAAANSPCSCAPSADEAPFRQDASGGGVRGPLRNQASMAFRVAPV